MLLGPASGLSFDGPASGQFGIGAISLRTGEDGPASDAADGLASASGRRINGQNGSGIGAISPTGSPPHTPPRKMAQRTGGELPPPSPGERPEPSFNESGLVNGVRSLINFSLVLIILGLITMNE